MLSLLQWKIPSEAGSVIELGGQDAKIIIWIQDPMEARENSPA